MEKPTGKMKRKARRRGAIKLLLFLLALTVASDLLFSAREDGRWVARPLIQAYRAIPDEYLPHRCPSEPHCSEYAQQAVDRFGLIRGAFLTADRLIHEHGRLAEGPWVDVDGKKRLYDPLPDKLSFRLMLQKPELPEIPYINPDSDSKATSYGRAYEAGHESAQRLYDRGWKLLETGQWQAAAVAFDRVPVNSSLGAKAAWLSARAGKGDDLDMKSPSLAGWLSIVPGLGQLYVGRDRDAAWAAGLSFGLGGLAVGVIAVGAPVVTVLGAAMVTPVAAAFYGGNIHNAVTSAVRANDLTRAAFLARLKKDVAAVP